MNFHHMVTILKQTREVSRYSGEPVVFLAPALEQQKDKKGISQSSL